MAITKKLRQECEALVYQTMDALDKTRSNSAYYKELFAGMSDEKFYNYMKNDFPFKFHMKPFEIEPKMEDIQKAAKILNIPLLEKIRMPHIYVNSKGQAVMSKECMVGYIHLKKVQQFITKKNSMSTSIDDMDMKTGLLIGHDKNAKTSDREMEALAVNNMNAIMTELSRPRADGVKSRNAMMNTINTTGKVSLADIPIEQDDSIAKNLLNTYLIGACIQSNLINQDYYLPHTLKNRQKQINRV